MTLPSIPLDRPTYQARIRHTAAYLTIESCGIFAIASAMCFTPSGPMSLLAILQAKRVAVGQMQMRDSARYHICSQIWPILPERRHLTLLEALAKRSDALGGECAIATPTDTAELVAFQAARNKP